MGNKYIMRNCYWRHEYQDMNATVPTCDYYGRYGSCLCSDECEHYISEQEAENVIRKRVEAGHSHEDGQWFDLTEALTVKRTEWIPCSERLPSKEDCPMDCLVTRKSNFIGDYVDMAVAEANGTWTHEDWDAIVLGDVESGRKTGLISTRDDDIVAWMPLPTPYKGGDSK